MTPEMLMLLVGTAGGFIVGRWWSEVFRGRYDAGRAWKSRRNYRRRK
jgi:hypothetical protein